MQITTALDSSSYLSGMVLSEYKEQHIHNYLFPFTMQNGLTTPFLEKIYKIREMFHSGEISYSPFIRPSIMRSWQRAYAAGVVSP